MESTTAPEIKFIDTKPGFIHDSEFKIVYIGDKFCGKTQFRNRFCRNKFEIHSKSTIGVEFSSKYIKLPSGEISKLQI